MSFDHFSAHHPLIVQDVGQPLVTVLSVKSSSKAGRPQRGQQAVAKLAGFRRLTRKFNDILVSTYH